jgi:hypothetical protein
MLRGLLANHARGLPPDSNSERTFLVTGLAGNAN